MDAAIFCPSYIILSALHYAVNALRQVGRLSKSRTRLLSQ
jgi:hypothetical protein